MILLDTCTLLWLAIEPRRLSVEATRSIRSQSGALYVSAISGFEIALECRKKKLALPTSAGSWYEMALDHHGIREIPISGRIAVASAELAPIHQDPCDRIIVASALDMNLPVVTPDQWIGAYRGVTTIW